MDSVIFGAGYWGRRLKKGLEEHCGVHICAIITNNENRWGEKIDDVAITSPKKIVDINFEKVFICAMKDSSCSEMETQLINMGIPREKIEVMKTSIEYMDAFMSEDFLRKNWIKSFSLYTKEVGMSGSVAECGVLLGETAMFINRCWPDRALHLFDTFEGFPDEDLAYDLNTFPEFKNGSLAGNPFKFRSPDSLVEKVKERMCCLDNIRIHKGRFPQCADNIEDRFCFVSLDMDLYQPQLGGLRYFWDKMEIGGIILLHDYYPVVDPKAKLPTDCPGVKSAILDFEKELGDTLLKFPIGDNCGMAVIKR